MWCIYLAFLLHVHTLKGTRFVNGRWEDRPSKNVCFQLIMPLYRQPLLISTVKEATVKKLMMDGCYWFGLASVGSSPWVPSQRLKVYRLCLEMWHSTVDEDKFGYVVLIFVDDERDKDGVWRAIGCMDCEWNPSGLPGMEDPVAEGGIHKCTGFRTIMDWYWKD